MYGQVASRRDGDWESTFSILDYHYLNVIYIYYYQINMNRYITKYYCIVYLIYFVKFSKF
jgi:hypothetical protein